MMTPKERERLRNEAAVAALQGLIASNFYDRYNGGVPADLRPRDARCSAVHAAVSIAVEYADELIKRLEIEVE